MTREEMREKVAQLFCGGNNPCDACFKDADAAIAIIRGEVLEEAARVADVAAMVYGSEYSIDDIRDVAAAIRALKEKSNG